MSYSDPDWRDVLPKPRKGAQLEAAWFTTYDQPDYELLVEHLLPSLLCVNHSIAEDAEDRIQFFGELNMQLERLRDKLTIISSPSFETGVSRYPWLSRHINHFTVGAKGHAIQHAKLWAFHWKRENEEYLEFHVSSINLTLSAFKGQIQAGWNTCVDLEKNSTKETCQSWGDLIPFIEALGESAGRDSKKQMGNLIALLSRAKCPNGVIFVASAPNSNLKGAKILKNLKPSAIHILAPTIGDWTQETLMDWADDIGITPNKIHLKWISKDHPWAIKGGWALTEKAYKALRSVHVRLAQLPNDLRLCKEDRNAVDRWSHAKLYLLRIPNKKKRHLLVTSANWSLSAWGAGKVNPRNFELGVIFPSEWKWLEGVDDELCDPHFSMRATMECKQLHWVQASWDGNEVLLEARSSEKNVQIKAKVILSDNSTIICEGDFHGCEPVKKIWYCPEIFPVNAEFSQSGETLVVNVIDSRPLTMLIRDPIPEIDPDLSQELREAFLLQQYGGIAIDTESVRSRIGGANQKTMRESASNYSIESWLYARAGFNVIDQWCSALKNSQGEEKGFFRVLLDGETLRNYYTRSDSPAGDVIAEELGWHLKQAKGKCNDRI